MPLGAFLSGGIDSTIIVGLMSRLAAEPVRTFSIGFPVKEFDETHYARAAAERFGTIHEEFQVRPDAMEILPRLVWHYDEPFADSSAVPTWYVSQLTRQRVTVALTGDGGDELFAGYPRYLAVWLAEGFDRLPALAPADSCGRLLAAVALGHAAEVDPAAFQAVCRDARAVAAAALSGMDRHFRRSASRRHCIATSSWPGCPTKTRWSFLPPRWHRSKGRDAITAFSLADLVTYLPCDLMTKVDIASMAHGLECRQPFLDYRVVELAARMPRRLKFRRGRGKLILREAFADLLPRVDPASRRRWASACRWTTGSATSCATSPAKSSSTARPSNAAISGPRRSCSFGTNTRTPASTTATGSGRCLILELWQREWIDGGRYV